MRMRIPPTEKAWNAGTGPPMRYLHGSSQLGVFWGQTPNSCTSEYGVCPQNSLRDQLPEYVLQDSAVPIVVNLVWGIDARYHLECLVGAFPTRTNRYKHAGLDALGDSTDIESFKTGQAVGGRAFAFFELQRQHAHAHQVAPVNALKTFGEDGLHT